MNNDSIPKDLLLDQLAEALEERQNPDRRQRDAGLPQGVKGERRRGDRRQHLHEDHNPPAQN